MEGATSSFNAAASEGPAQTISAGEVSGGGPQDSAYAPPVNDNNAAEVSTPQPPGAAEPSDAPAASSSPAPETQVEESLAEDPAGVATDNAEAEAQNKAQDDRLADEALISEETFQARQKLEDDLARRYGDATEMLKTDIADLQDVLDNSGPARLAWLKFTNQIPKDPQADLKMLKSGLATQERLQSEEREAFEARIWNQVLLGQAERQNNEAGQNQTSANRLQTRNTMTRGQASERLAFLEDHRPAPASELHLRPGGRTEEYVHSDVAARQEGEISLLRAFLKAHDGPENDPDFDPDSAPDHEYNDGFEPLF